MSGDNPFDCNDLGGVAIIPGRIAAVLTDLLPDLDNVRISTRGDDYELTQALQALYNAGMRWRVSSTGRTTRYPAEVKEPLAVMSTGQVAATLGITTRAVRTAAERGRLNATKNFRGEWLFLREDVAHFRANRTRGEA